MLFLVNDILDFAQLESKTIILNKDNFNVKELLNECRDMLKQKADSKNLPILVDMEDNVPKEF